MPKKGVLKKSIKKIKKLHPSINMMSKDKVPKARKEVILLFI